MFRRLLALYLIETSHARTWVFLAVVLALALAFALLPQSGDSGGVQVYRPIRMSVVDEDNSMISGALVSQLKSIRTLDHVYAEDMVAARNRLDAGETLLLLHIPEGFYARARNPEQSIGVEVWFNDEMPTEAAVFVRFLNSAADSVSASKAALFAFEDEVGVLLAGDGQAQADESEAAMIALVLRLVARKSIVGIEESAKLDTGVFILSALTCLYAMMTTLLMLPVVRRERASGVFDRLLQHGVSWWKPALARILIGLLWLSVGIGPLFAILLQNRGMQSPWMPMVAIVLLYGILSLLVQAWAQVAPGDDTALLSAWTGLLAFLLLGGCIYPIRLLPVWLRTVGMGSPARWTFDILYQSLSGGRPALRGLAVLAGMMIPAALLAWRAWRKEQWAF